MFEEVVGKVTITRREFEELVITREKYKMLCKALMTNATLSWRDGELNLDDDTASTCLRVMEPTLYKMKIDELKIKKGKDDESNK